MKRVNERGTKQVIFEVEMPGVGAPAVLKMVCGDRDHIPYLWIGAPDDGPCLGTMDAKELRKLARVILEEIG